MTDVVTALDELDSADSPAVPPGTRERFAELLARDPSTLHRDGGPLHLTASAIVVDAPGENVALVWHRKGSFWVQPGGHLEPDEDSFERAARREAEEETGLTDLTVLGPGPAMLHSHTLKAAFGACHEHWDVQYLMRAALPAAELPLRPSDETPESIWVPWPRAADGTRAVPELPAGTVANMADTLRDLGPMLDRLLG